MHPSLPRIFPHRRGLCALVPLLLVALLAGCGSGAAGPRATTPAAAPSIGGAPGGTVTYVALGASDAFGVGTDDPDRQNWPTLLGGELGRAVHTVNLGLPGATVAQAQQAELPVALASHPDIVTIWLAVNDLANGVDLSTYTAQLTSLLTTLRQGTQARIFVGNLPDLSQLPYFSAEDPAALQAQVRAWNAAIASTCAATGAHLVDLARDWGAIADHPEYIADDGLHPSTLGAQRLADVFATAIQQAGAP